MSWYHTIKESALNRAEIWANQVTPLVFKEVVSGPIDFNIPVNDIPGLDSIFGYVDFDLAYKDIIIQASCYLKRDGRRSIGLSITLPKDFDKKMYQELNYRLREAIRHEMEHTTQSSEDILQEGGTQQLMGNPFKDLETAERYLLSSREMPAWVSSFYYLAKKKRKPFLVVLDDYMRKIEESFLFRNFDEQEIRKVSEKIKMAWINYAKTRFPLTVVERETTSV